MENLEQPNIKISPLNFETIFKFCPDAIVFKDSELCYSESNECYNKIFSSNKFDTIIGKRNNPYLSNRITKLIQDADTEVMKSCSPLNYVITLENGMLLNITTFPILYKSKFFGLISIIKDITQEEAIKEDFVNKHFEYINTERNLQKQRESFVASLGHDLKNPTIAQIRGLELLLKGEFGAINSEQQELLEMVLDSCKYMNGMLSSLLATYRNSNGIVVLNFENFIFSDLVNECVSEMTYVAKDKGVSIHISKTIEKEIIYADRVQIKRVIMNLISNGIKYAYKDSILKLKITNDTKITRFEFENNSPFIPKEKQQAIFAQYVSYAERHQEFGIGLGLFASKKIIEGHHGKIYVQSYKDNRNIFGFKIPTEQNPNFTDKQICF